ncbi:MAG: hypothetical protein MH204_00050 [Fimbriimonadaceae bacterium]|nr:hypothetical protein [Fimbriimonadaceae bacterium]
MPPRWDRQRGRPEPIRALNRVREIENHEPMVDLREAAPSIRLIREGTIPFCRRTVAEMAQRAAESLPSGVHLAVTDAWRPLERQQKISEWIERCIREAFPGISHAALRRRACRWVAPVDQKAPPGHCTGAALDVCLVDDADEPLDVISPFERFEASPTYTFGLSEESHRNRMMMVEAMLGVGFSNCRDEYWHYSYGDAGWAVRMGLDACVYGLVELDPEHWESKQAAWLETFNDRANPFLEGRA